MRHDLVPMDLTFTAILLGIVEGLTEFLPVSSTGHLILATRLFGYDSSQWATFNIVIQLGAILAVIVQFWRTFWAVGMGLLKLNATSIRFVRNVLLAFIPSAILGLLLNDWIEGLLGEPAVVAWALIIGGMFGALGGIVYVLAASVQADAMGRSLTFFAYTALLLGGAATIFGPVLGTVLFYVGRIFVKQTANAYVPDSIMNSQDTEAFSRFFNAMLDQGVHLPPSAYESWFVSASHDDEAVAHVIDALPVAARAAAAPTDSAATL